MGGSSRALISTGRPQTNGLASGGQRPKSSSRRRERWRGEIKNSLGCVMMIPYLHGRSRPKSSVARALERRELIKSSSTSRIQIFNDTRLGVGCECHLGYLYLIYINLQ